MPTTGGLAGPRMLTYIPEEIRKAIGPRVLSVVVCVRSSARCRHSPDSPVVRPALVGDATGPRHPAVDALGASCWFAPRSRLAE